MVSKSLDYGFYALITGVGSTSMSHSGIRFVSISRRGKAASSETDEQGSSAMTIYSTTSNAPRSGMQLSFADEFNGTARPDDAGSVWNTVFPGNLRWIGTNNEKQIYLDRDFRAPDGSAVAIDPFSTGDGTLTITTRPTPAALLADVYNQPYTSGMINSAGNAEFKYGYIEFRADFPGGKGLWPALWMRSVDSSVKTEIDLVELIGQMPNSLFQTVHSADGVVHKVVREQVTDLTQGFHSYGVDWQQDKITFYLDGKAMGSILTPESLKVPMYLIANTAVGGWAGNPDGTTVWPAVTKIDYVRVWQDASDLASKTIQGTANAETLAGNDGADVIYGGGGNDTIFGAAGNDKIYGGAGNDRILAGMGDDTIDGGGGTDFLSGGMGNDTYIVNTTGATLYEQAQGGIDTIVTSFSSWTLTAMFENLTYSGSGAFRGVGNASNNVIIGGAGADTLIASGGDDRLEGGAGNDNLDAGAGNDTLWGGQGNDTLRGGDGRDSFVVKSGDGGTDTVMDFSVANDRIDVSGLGIASLADALSGASGNKIVLGGTTMVLNNVAMAALTADNFVFYKAPPIVAVAPVAGNDLLEGTTGADTLAGGAGDDTYIVDNVGDVVVEKAGAGFDTVKTALSSYTLGGQVEALTYTGTETFRGVGNGLDNVLTSQGGTAELIGGAGNDRLVGSTGNDRLVGGIGDDVLKGNGGTDLLFGNDGADLFVFSSAPGKTTVADFRTGVDHLDVAGLGFASFEDVLAHAVQSGTSTVITADASHVVVLQNTQIGTLAVHDFVF